MREAGPTGNESVNPDANEAPELRLSVDALLAKAHEHFHDDPQQATDYATVAFMRATEGKHDTRVDNPLAAHAAYLGYLAVMQTGPEPHIQAMWRNRLNSYGRRFTNLPSSDARAA